MNHMLSFEGFAQQKLEAIYREADQKVWQFVYGSAILVFVEGLLYKNPLVSVAGILINLLALFLVDKLVRRRKYKNTLMGLAILLWPVLIIITSDQMLEIRFVTFCFIALFAIYQDPRPIISMSVIAAVLVLGYSLPIIYDFSSFRSYSLLLIRPEDISLERMFATLAVLAISASVSIWLAKLLQRRSISEAEKEFSMLQKQRIGEKNQKFATSMAEGNLDLTLDTEDDESDTLTAALEEMRKNLKTADEKERQDRFTNVGLAEIGDILRKNNDNIEALTDQVLRYLVKYLDVNQGALYMLEGEDDERKLVQAACYAFDKKKFQEKEVYVGQGLLGQVVLEQETIYLTDVPQNYINITSGLGGANPSCLLLIPLIVNEEIFGAIELASFKNLLEHEITFTEKVAVSIASAINAAKSSENTNKLLASAQEQTEMLQSQEEEMRQNMEELTATQEEIERKSLEMEGRINAINISGVASVEFELDGTIISANEAFLDLFGYSEQEVLGKHHRMFVATENAARQEFQIQWDQVLQGEKVEGEFERLHKSGKVIYIKGAYSCILDVNHQPVKIIKLATDITETKTLFMEAQEQTRQIAAQEEEIRQSLEHLQELQLESNKRMQEMNYYLEALNTSMITLELDAEGNILDANEALTNLLGYSSPQLKALKHADLMKEEDVQNDAYQELWQHISEGKNYHTMLRRKASQGEIRWFRSYYFPKADDHGNITKVIELSSDFTKEKMQEEKIIQNEKILHERVKNIEDKAYERIVKLKKDMKQKLAEKDDIIATLEKK